MKRKIISIFFVLITMLFSCGIYGQNIPQCFADSRKYEISTTKSVQRRLHFIVRDGIEERLDDVALKLKYMGFSDKTIAKYLFTNYDDVVKSLQNENLEVVNSEIIVEQNRVYPTSEANGKTLEVDLLDSLIVSKVLANEPFMEVPFKVVPASVTYEQNLEFCNLKSHFTTQIKGINQQGRIHNINQALSKFNGMRVESGEVVSFNDVIGNTTKENGYALAKVIINGKYEDDYGGGVCQASSTLYNALLLADIEVLQANPHSLKVGYVESSFDAMVSYGISDMVFKNSSGGPIFISTFCNGNECGATIYGSENEYDIVRRSENIDFNQEEFPRVGSKSAGYLEYYKNGEKLFEKKIRKDNYYKLNVENV